MCSIHTKARSLRCAGGIGGVRQELSKRVDIMLNEVSPEICTHKRQCAKETQKSHESLAGISEDHGVFKGVRLGLVGFRAALTCAAGFLHGLNMGQWYMKSDSVGSLDVIDDKRVDCC